MNIIVINYYHLIDMKKAFFTICVLLIAISINAQNSYLYLKAGYGMSYKTKITSFGEVLNEYLKEGFYVKMMSCSGTTSGPFLTTILSNDSHGDDIISYVLIYNHNGSLYLSGDVPSNMEKVPYNNYREYISKILEELSKNGFQLELFDADSHYEYFLLAKRKSGSTSVRGISSDNEDVIEMARYNLKGMPVDKNYKGIQIIVYSNYTTKVVNLK